MEIQHYKSENSIVPSRDGEIKLALQTRLFANLEQKEAYPIVKNAIVKAYISARYEMPEAFEIEIIIDETMKAIKNKFGSLREEELSIAISRGLIGEYGDFKGISMITIIHFVKAYLKEESRIKLLTPMEEKKEPTLQERFSTAKNLALSTFEKFINGQSIELEGATVYRFLAKLKIIEYSEEEKEEFVNSAQEEVIAKKQREKFTSMDKHVRAKIERELNDLSSLNDRIKFTAQHNGLVTFFQSVSFEEEKPIAYLAGCIDEAAKKYLN